MSRHVLTYNITIGRVKREVRNGRNYLVADSTIIVPGVLAGSKGSLYYPEREVSDNPSKWNNILVTENHPYDPATGEPLSANSPGVKERQGIGFTEKSFYKGASHEHPVGKLNTRIVFDEELTRQKSKTIYSKLMNNEPIELSTGLFTTDTASQGKDPRTGRNYDFIAKNYRPDHLAILPNQTGACSLNDGCGVLINSDRSAHGVLINSTNGTLVNNHSIDTVELLRQQNLAQVINALQGRHPKTGQFQNGVHSSVKRGHQQTDWESPNEELHEDDADAELIGRKNKPGRGQASTDSEDGRQLTTLDTPDNKGIAEFDTPNSSLDTSHTEETTEEEELKTPQGKNKKNLGEEGKNTYKANAWSEEARQAAVEARKASGTAKAATDKANEHGVAAGAEFSAHSAVQGPHSEHTFVGGRGDSKESLQHAAMHHEAAADAHRDKAKESTGEAKQQHLDAAKSHDAAKQANQKALDATKGFFGRLKSKVTGNKQVVTDGNTSAELLCLSNVELTSNAEFESDEQRMAFFGKLMAGDIKGSGKAKGKESASKEEHDKAMEKTEAATKRSALVKKAGGDRRTKEHGKAAVAHREAAQAHSALHEKTGDSKYKEAAEAHTKFANEHEAASRQSTTHNQQYWNTYYTYNAKWTQGKRDALKSKDFAGPDQSFPIKDQSDVGDAWQLRGHADNPEAVGDKIKTIAKRKGLTPPKGESSTSNWLDETSKHNWEVTEQEDIDEIKSKKKKANNSLYTPYNYGQGQDNTTMYGPTAHDTSMSAAHASLGTEHGPAIKHANDAVKHSGNDSPAKAISSHDMASKEHDKEAMNCLKCNDMEGANEHTQASTMHKMAGMHQKASMKNNSRINSTTTDNYDPNWASNDDERRAVMAHITAGEHSNEAAEASSSARGKEGHAKAAEAHSKAAKSMAKSGNKTVAKAHREAAAYHRSKSGSTTNQQGVDMFKNVDEAREFLVANCECAEEKAALNELDPKTLFKLALNKKAEGSNADVTDGTGDIQAGGEEDTDDDKHDENWDDKTERDSKVKKTAMNSQQWLNLAPVEMQDSLREGLVAAKQVRQNIVNRLTANISSKDQKARMIKDFMNPEKYTLNRLKDMLAMIPPTNNVLEGWESLAVVNPSQQNFPNFLGAAGDMSTGQAFNTSKIDDEVLEVTTLNYADVVKEQSTKKTA